MDQVQPPLGIERQVGMHSSYFVNVAWLTESYQIYDCNPKKMHEVILVVKNTVHHCESYRL